MKEKRQKYRETRQEERWEDECDDRDIAEAIERQAILRREGKRRLEEVDRDRGRSGKEIRGR